MATIQKKIMKKKIEFSAEITLNISSFFQRVERPDQQEERCTTLNYRNT